jgi:serine/threonine protein phosphatase PrpC
MAHGWRNSRHASCSTAGRRTANEDRAATLRLGRSTYVAVVADGVGGAVAGGVASERAMTAFLDAMRSSGTAGERGALRVAFAAADAAVREAATGAREGMGTTLIAAIIREGGVWVGNVGDSRAVLVVADEVIPLSREDSVVAEALRSGAMTELEALHSRERHVISRALGDGDARPEIKYQSLRKHPNASRAVILAGSDGLFNFVGETEILEITETQLHAGRMAEELVRRAVENGSDDNVSAAAVAIDLRPPRRWLRTAAAVVLAAAIGAAAYPMRHELAHRLGVVPNATTPSPLVRQVRLSVSGTQHIVAGMNGTLCSGKRCFGTWRVLKVDGSSVVLELRSEEAPSAAPRGAKP